MSDVRKSEKVEVASGLGSSVLQASSEATRRLLEQGQTFVGAIVEWNSEISQFFSHRIARNSEAFTRLTKCQGFSDAFAIQASNRRCKPIAVAAPMRTWVYTAPG